MNTVANKLKLKQVFSLATFLLLIFTFSFFSNASAQALSQAQIEALQSGDLYFNTDYCGSSSTPSSTSTSSSGSTLGQGSSVYILGDSITDRAAASYTSLLQGQGFAAELDFADGRGIVTPGNGDTANTNNLTGMQAVTNDATEVSTAGAIVVALGTNDVNNEDTAQNVDQLISTIRSENSSAPIYWVDVYAINSSILTSAQVGQINTVIYGEATKDNYQVIPWFKTVDPSGNPINPSNPEVDPYQYIDDTDGYGVHPDPSGVTALTSAVLNQVLSGNSSASTSTSSSSNQSNCCNPSGSVGGPSGGGPLADIQFPQVGDTAAFAANINSYIQSTEPSSPFVGMGDVYVEAGQKYDVNPALMVAIAQKESSLGTNQPSGSNDAWGLTARGDVSNYPFENGIYYFPSWTIGIYEATQYVGNNYAIPGSSYYSVTVEQLMTHYTPGNVQEQTQVTLAVMQKITNGLSTQGSGTTPSTTTTTTSATTSTSSGSSDTGGGSSTGSSATGSGTAGSSTAGGGSCGSSTSSSGTAAGLTDPFPNGWIPGRLDMGYDGHFTDQIVAPCSGTMSYVDADSSHAYNGGWEGAYFTLKCSTTPPGLPTDTFYFAEGVSPTVTQGQSVNSGQQIAVPGWTGYTEGPGGIEWGLAMSNNPQQTVAANLGNSCTVGSASQQMVMNFSQWFQQNLHVAQPATTDHAGCA